MLEKKTEAGEEDRNGLCWSCNIVMTSRSKPEQAWVFLERLLLPFSRSPRFTPGLGGSSLDQPLLCVSISFYCLFDRIIIAVHRIVVLIIVIILPVADWGVFAVAIVALIVLHPYNSLFVFPLISNFSSSFHLRFLSLGLGCIERSRPTSSQYR